MDIPGFELHPGEFIREIYIKPFELSVRKVAISLTKKKVNLKTVKKLKLNFV